MTAMEEGWVPAACTLPTAAQPLRQVEFDRLFATALRDQQRLSATRVRWQLDPAAEAEARQLAQKETGCCSFFTFTFSSAGAGLQLEIEVPEPYVPVLDALAARAAAGMAR